MVRMNNMGAMLGRSRRLLNEFHTLPQGEKDIYIIISRIMASIISYIKRNPGLRTMVLDKGITDYPLIMGYAWAENNELARTKRFGVVVGEEFEGWERSAGKLEEKLSSSQGEPVKEDKDALIGIHAQCQVMFKQYLDKNEYLKEVLDAYRQIG